MNQGTTSSAEAKFFAEVLARALERSMPASSTRVTDTAKLMGERTNIPSAVFVGPLVEFYAVVWDDFCHSVADGYARMLTEHDHPDGLPCPSCDTPMQNVEGIHTCPSCKWQEPPR